MLPRLTTCARCNTKFRGSQDVHDQTCTVQAAPQPKRRAKAATKPKQAKRKARVEDTTQDEVGKRPDDDEDDGEEKLEEHPHNKRKATPSKAPAKRSKPTHDDNGNTNVIAGKEGGIGSEDNDVISLVSNANVSSELTRACYAIADVYRGRKAPPTKASWNVVWMVTQALWKQVNAVINEPAQHVKESTPPNAIQWQAGVTAALELIKDLEAQQGECGEESKSRHDDDTPPPTPTTVLPTVTNRVTTTTTTKPTPATPPRLTFLSHGPIPTPDRRNDTVFVRKAESGQMATVIGDSTSGRRFHFNLSDHAELANMLACQHSQAGDAAVFTNATAMADFTADILPARYPDSLAQVKATIISGNIKSILDFAPHEQPLTLRTVELAMRNLARELKQHYGSWCQLVKPLEQLVERGTVEDWYKDAIDATKALNGESFVQHLAQAAAAEHVKQRIDHAIKEWQRQANIHLEEHFTRANMVTEKVDGVIVSFRRVGAMSTFPAIDFYSCLNRTPLFVPQYHRQPAVGTSASSSNGGAGGYSGSTRPNNKRGKKFATVDDRPKVDLGKLERLPEVIVSNQGKNFRSLLRKQPDLPIFTFNGSEVCMRNLLCGTGNNGCSRCDRIHYYTAAGKQPPLTMASFRQVVN